MSDVYTNKAKLIVGNRGSQEDPLSLENVKKAIFYTLSTGAASIKINGTSTALPLIESGGGESPRYLELEFGGDQNTFDILLDSTLGARIYYIIQLA